MRTRKTICSTLFTVICSALLIITGTALLFSRCVKVEDRKVTAPIISTRYSNKTGNFLVMLEGSKAISAHQTRLKITIRPGTVPTLVYFVNSHGNNVTRNGVKYEFIFSDYDQAKKYLHLESGKDGLIHVEAEATSNACFISSLMRGK